MPESASARGESRWLWAIVLLALVLRFGVLWFQHDQLTHDRDAYLGIAQNLVAGTGYSTPGTTTTTAFRPPLYPILLAVAMTVLPAACAVAFWNLLAGVTTVWCVDRLGIVLGLGGSRHFASLLVAVDPLLLNATPQPMTEVVFTALTTAWLWAVTSAWDPDANREPDALARESCHAFDMRRAPRWRVGLSGLMFGLAALCRPTIWPLAGLMAIVWLVSRKSVSSPPPRGRGAGERGEAVPRTNPSDAPTTDDPHKRALGSARPLSLTLSPGAGARGLESLRSMIPILVGTLIVIAPWAIRNQLVLGHPVWTTTHGGYTLLLANNPTHDAEVVRQPWGATWSADSLNRWQTEVDAEARAALGPQADDEAVKDRWLSNRAQDYMQHHPDRLPAAMGHRVRKLWSVSPQGEGRAFPPSLRMAVAAFYLLEYALALWGCWRIVRGGEWRAWLPGLLLIVTIQGVHLFYWTDARMRTPLVPVLALLAARGVSSTSGRREGGEIMNDEV